MDDRLVTRPFRPENPFKPSPGSPEQESGVRRKPVSDLEKFGLAESEHPLAKRYAPVYLGHGGEHLVYRIPGRPGVVVKANKKVLYDTLAQDPSSYELEDVKGSGALRQANLELEKERKLQVLLRRFFGQEHLLSQKKYLTKVPVTKTILEEIERQFDPDTQEWGAIPDEAREAWTIVTVQRKQDMPEGETECPKSSYPEIRLVKKQRYKDELLRSEYAVTTDALMRGDRAEEIAGDDFVDMIGSVQLRRFAERLRIDPGLREATRDFTERAIAFAEATGEILDVVGMNNIVFFKRAGHWTYKLIDPLYPFADHVLERARTVYAGKQDYGKLEEEDKKKLEKEDMNALVHGVVFTRLINGLALLVNEEEKKKPESERKLAPYIDFLPAELMTVSMADKLFPPLPKKKAA